MPLSPGLLGYLSPSIAELLPLWTSTGDALGSWSTVSLDPESTRGGLVVLLAYAILFVLVVQRVQSLSDAERLLRWIAFAAIGMAALGLIQLLLGNGKFLWLFEHPSRDTHGVVKGAFHNQNHLAHFLALGVGPILWCLWKAGGSGAARRDGARQAWAVGLGVVAFAGLLTFSRGGVIVLALAVAVCVGVYYWKSILGAKSLVVAGGMGLVIAAALLIHGYEPLARRLATLRDSRSLEEISLGREALWSALAQGIPQFAIMGSGIGSHRVVHPIFMEEHFDFEFTHGENGYLPLLLEAGVPGLLLMLIGMGVSFFWCVRVLSQPVAAAEKKRRPAFQWRETQPAPKRTSPQRDAVALVACGGAILPGIVASTVHSLGDFVWYISACMSITVVLVATACRLYQLGPGGKHRPATRHRGMTRGADSGSKRLAGLLARIRVPRTFAGPVALLSRPAWIANAVLASFACLAMLAELHAPAMAAPHWYAYRRIALAKDPQLEPGEAEQRAMLQRMATHLNRALVADPFNPRFNLRLVNVYLRRFELEQRHAMNPMALSQIRDAALASRFPTREAQDRWLDVAVGENRLLLDRALRHCRRGLEGCPLEGEGYVYLGELSFLEGAPAAAKRALIAQARQVRPRSGMVLFATGQEAAYSNDLANALKYWKAAFHQDRELQSLIVETLSPMLPASFFLDHFQPDRGGLSRLYYAYSRLRRVEDARLVGREYARALEQAASLAEADAASDILHRLQSVHAYLGEDEKALSCQRRAVELDPGNFQKRRALALLLVRQQRFSEAVAQFQWCLRRRPDDPALTRQLADARREEIQRQSAAARGTIGRGQRR